MLTQEASQIKYSSQIVLCKKQYCVTLNLILITEIKKIGN